MGDEGCVREEKLGCISGDEYGGFFFGKVEVVLSLDFRSPGGLGDDLLGRYRS